MRLPIALALTAYLTACADTTTTQSFIATETTPSEYPVLLIPGVAGSVLQAGSDDSRKIVWVASFSLNVHLDSYAPVGTETCTRSFGYSYFTFKICYDYTGGDANFKDYLLGRFDAKSGSIISAFSSSAGRVAPLTDDLCAFSVKDKVTQNRLCGVSYLAASAGTGFSQLINEYLFTYLNGELGAGVDYYGPMVDQIRDNYGFVAGENLFGFPYDWRLSNISNADLLAERVNDICANTGKKINIVAHSMGNLLTMAFLANHSDVAERCVANWIAIAAPFQGAGGNIYQATVEGYNFGDVFVCRCTSRPFSVQAPSVFELMPSPNYPVVAGSDPTPFIKYKSPNGMVTLDSRDDLVGFLREGYADFTFCNGKAEERFSLNEDSYKSGVTLRDSVIPKLDTVPYLPKVFIVYGTQTQTIHGVEYTAEFKDAKELIANCGANNCGTNTCDWPSCNLDSNPSTQKCTKNITFIDGDGSVATVSATKPPFHASHVTAQVEVPNVEHVELVKNKCVIQKVFSDWLGYTPKSKTEISPTCVGALIPRGISGRSSS